MYTEQSIYLIGHITEDYQIHVQRVDRVFKDGVKISETYHRHVVEPGQDLTNEDEKVKKIAQLFHTPEVIRVRKEFLKRQKLT